MHITHKSVLLGFFLLVGSLIFSQTGSIDWAKASINIENGANYPATATGNLFDDESFESGKIGVNVVGSREGAWRQSNMFEGISNVVADARTGSKAVEVKRWGVGQVVAIKGAPKSTFTYSVWAKAAAGNTSPQVAVIELTHLGQQTKQNYASVVVQPGDGWKKVEVSYTLPEYPSYGNMPGFVGYLWQNCSAENCFYGNNNQGIIFDDAELKVTSGNAYLLTGNEGKAKIGAFYNQKWDNSSPSYTAANAFLSQNTDMRPFGSTVFNSEDFLSKEIRAAASNGVQFFAYDFGWNLLGKQPVPNKNYALEYIKSHPETNVQMALHLPLSSDLLLAKESDITALGNYIASNYTTSQNYLKGEDGRSIIFIGGYTETALSISKEKVKKIVDILSQTTNLYPVLVINEASTLTNGATLTAKETGFAAYVVKTQVSFAKQRVGNVLTFKTFHDLFEELAQYTYGNSGDTPLYPSVRAFYDSRFHIGKEPMVILETTAKWFMYSLHVAKNTISSINAVNPLFMLDGWNDLDEGSTLLPTEKYGTSLLDQVKIISACIKAKVTDESCWLYK